MRVLLHGLGQTPASWDRVAALAGGPESISAPDLCAFLRGQEATYGRLYGAFAGHCDALPGRLQVCGLSLGAVLALQYAAERPEKMRSLVLIGGQYKMPKALLRLQGVLFRLMPAASFGPAGFPKAELIRLTGSMAELDLSQSMAKITCPALVVCGERDRANQKAARQLAAGIPGAALRLVPGAGHEVNTEAPEALAALLGSFWQSAGT